MRVCMLAGMMPAHATGGMEIHALELAKGLAALGHDVTVLTGKHPSGLQSEDIEGAKIIYTNAKATTKLPLGWEAFRRLEELHKEKKFDVVHSQSYLSAYNFVAGGLKKRLGIPLVTTLHGTPSSEIRSNLNQGFTAMLIPKLAFHTFNYHFRAKFVVRSSDAVIAISRELADGIPKEFGIEPTRVKAIYNGIDTSTFKPAANKAPGIFSSGRILLSVSVLHKQKGVQYLIEAMNEIVKKVPDVHLMIVGDGPYRKELEALADNLALRGHVTFAGKKRNRELVEYYNAADAFIIPTVRVEGLPLIELEAMSSGLPVIASNIGGIPTVIDNGVNGILVKPGDVGELTANIIDVLSDHKLAKRLADRARTTIMEGFSRERMSKDTADVYSSVTAKPDI
jgi:glycogen synthase